MASRSALNHLRSRRAFDSKHTAATIAATKRTLFCSQQPPQHPWHSGLKKGDKVYIGMSGGVDSSVAAHLLKSHGLDVEAVFMRNWDTRDEYNECPSERDWRDVQRVCQQLEIKCHEVNLVKEYWNSVFSVALDEYSNGLTPNPDVLCNREIKFGVLLEHIGRRRSSPGGWRFATGHYARTCPLGCLYRGIDGRKDQSYYLANVSAQALGRVVFPLGGLRKVEDVRRIAAEATLLTANKEESMGICFVGERRRFDKFLAEYLPQNPGDILSSDGKRLGTHQGMFTKTIGQSAGIAGWQEKWYVYKKDVRNNRMFAVQGRNSPLLHKSSVVAGPVHWISGHMPDLGLRGCIDLDVQIRYMQKPQRCRVSMACEFDNRDIKQQYVKVDFDDPQFGVASGQYLALYSSDHCLGSAVIH